MYNSFKKSLKLVLDVKKPDRLDKTLVRMIPQDLGLSRSQIQTLMVSGKVSETSGKRLSEPAMKSYHGQEVIIEIPEPEPAQIRAEQIELDIYYEDAQLLVLNKPAGMIVHPAPGIVSGTLVNALLNHCCDSLSGIGGIKRPGIVHRIDKDTSGLLVVAKTDLAHSRLARQFYNRSIERRYKAFVYGNPLTDRSKKEKLPGVNVLTEDEIKIESRIARHKTERKKMAVFSDFGRISTTMVKLENSFKFLGHEFASIIDCKLKTGRTHQIRVHLAYLGHHIIGDTTYKYPRKSKLVSLHDSLEFIYSFPRQALHAETLGFVHPTNGKQLSFKAELPEDLKGLLVNLKAFS